MIFYDFMPSGTPENVYDVTSTFSLFVKIISNISIGITCKLHATCNLHYIYKKVFVKDSMSKRKKMSFLFISLP